MNWWYQIDHHGGHHDCFTYNWKRQYYVAETFAHDLQPVASPMQLIAYASNRMYTSFDNINFLEGPERRRTRRKAKSHHRYETTDSDDALPLKPYRYSKGEDDGYTDPYDPDHGREASESTLYSQGGGEWGFRALR